MDMESRPCRVRRANHACVRRYAVSRVAIAALASAAALLVASGCTRDIEGNDQREVSLDLSALLEYPGVTSFPQQVPEVDVHREPSLGLSWEFRPKEVYAGHHRAGWQDCLLLLGSEGVEVENEEVVGVWFHLAGEVGRYQFLGLKDGFEDCKRRIAVLRSVYGDGELRRVALRAFDKMSDPSSDYLYGERRSPWVTTRHVRFSTGTD